MNTKNNTPLKAVVIGCLTWAMCQTGFTAFKEISSTGNVAQASYNAQSLQRTSIESPDLNIQAPQKSSDIWSKISESTRYKSIGNDEQVANTTASNTEIKELREEVAQMRIEMAQMKSELQALQIEAMPGEKMLAKN